ncbi:hypothetical protein HYC85_032111 [Camellia sinensis]|uniref:Uncharacterized protein n=1 Tax=Camellia sinensis TaxID=4442 RepID=A0A7J7FUB3_CAMSI|nr:hypothetical protein HYC85_032111 [Camellia sinensis]
MWNFSQFIASKDKDFWGWFLLIFGSVFFVGFFYAAIILKFLPPSDNALISALQTDSDSGMVFQDQIEEPWFLMITKAVFYAYLILFNDALHLPPGVSKSEQGAPYRRLGGVAFPILP